MVELNAFLSFPSENTTARLMSITKLFLWRTHMAWPDVVVVVSLESIDLQFMR